MRELRTGTIGTALVVAVLGTMLVAPASQAAPKPRLKIVKLSDPPATANPGDAFDVRGKVENAGKRGARGRVTARLEAGGSDPVFLGETVTDRVRPGKKERFIVDAQIPADLAITEATTYDLEACVRATKGGRTRCKTAENQVTVSPLPNPQPGARTLGDELFPQIGNGGYDALHYDIELDYDPVANTFGPGTKTSINATATQDLSEFSLDFQDLAVSAVTVNGEAADDFSQVDAVPEFPEPGTQPMKLVVDPATDILEGETMEIVVTYTGEPIHVIDADGSSEGWIPACYPLDPPQTCDGAFVVNEPIGAQGWFPSNNFPTDKATFDTTITVPESHEAVGIGELVSSGPPAGGKVTWSWSEDDPTSTYLTTATVGDFIFTERDITESATGRALPQYEFIDATATADQQTAINAALARTEEMTNFLGARFGPYPYDSGGAVADRAAGVGYALEVATKSHYAGGFTTGNASISQGTLLHEISHQWMGNNVTLENWKDIWFQEGWAQWATWSWSFEDGTSPTSPAGQWQTNYASEPVSKWDVIPTELGNDPANLFSTFPTYTRGAMTYEGYRQIVGADRFFEFARELNTRFAFGNVSSDDVVDLALEISDFTGDDLALLEDYFDQWLNEAGRPTITPNDFT